MLLHLVSLENPVAKIAGAYKTIRKELEKYGDGLNEKEEVVILTKTDLVDEKTLAKKLKEAKKLNKEVLIVSILDDKQVKIFKDELIKILRGL